MATAHNQDAIRGPGGEIPDPARGADRADRPLADLYLEDETAWLDRTSRLVAERRLDELDCDHLSEYLDDMAKRDRREVENRLRLLIMHLLKWDHQPERRTRSWATTLGVQRAELQGLLTSSTLRNHAAEVLAEVYRGAVKLAANETGLPVERFPAECPYALDQLLEDD